MLENTRSLWGNPETSGHYRMCVKLFEGGRRKSPPTKMNHFYLSTLSPLPLRVGTNLKEVQSWIWNTCRKKGLAWTTIYLFKHHSVPLMICVCTLSTAVQMCSPCRVFLVCLMSSMERPHSSLLSGSPPSSREPKSLLVSCDEQARNQISKLIWLVEIEPQGGFIHACVLLFHDMGFRPESSFMGCGQWKGQSAIAQTNVLIWMVFSQHAVGAGLGKHCKWAGWGSVLVAQGCMAAGVACTACLPNTLKPPEAQVLVHLDKGSPPITVRPSIHIACAVSNINWLLKGFEGL